MKSIHTILIAVTALALTSAAHAQTEAPTPTFERFQMLLVDGQRVEGINGTVGDGILTGQYLDGSELSVPIDQIRIFDRYTGNKMKTGALIGGGVGLLLAVTSLIAAEAEASSDPYKEVDEGAIIPVFAACTALGVLVGSLIGSGTKTWERIPVADLNARVLLREGRVVLTFNF